MVDNGLEDMFMDMWVNMMVVKDWANDSFMHNWLNMVFVDYRLFEVVVNHWLNVDVMDWFVVVGHVVVMFRVVNMMVGVMTNFVVVVWSWVMRNFMNEWMNNFLVMVGSVVIFMDMWMVNSFHMTVVVSMVHVVLSMMSMMSMMTMMTVLGLDDWLSFTIFSFFVIFSIYSFVGFSFFFSRGLLINFIGGFLSVVIVGFLGQIFFQFAAGFLGFCANFLFGDFRFQSESFGMSFISAHQSWCFIGLFDCWKWLEKV